MTGSALLDTPRRTLAPVLAAGAGLAAAMGVGRFAYTPLLPAMVDAHHIDAHDGALIAAANYAGYLAGAVLLTRRPNLNSRTAFRVSAGILVVSEALVALPGPTALPALLRLIAGLASAVLFVGCAGAIARLGGQGHGAGVAFGGVGFGIALTGLAALAARPVLPWQGLWLGAAVLTAVLLLPALRLDIHPSRDSAAVAVAKRSSTAWRALLIAYALEGVGYIVIGTFLVAAVGAHNAALGSAIWVIVGVAAAPAVLWSMVARRWTPTTTVVLALLAQCAAAALLAGSTSTWPAIVAAALFGGTFMGITMLTIRLGTELTDHRAAATLTAGYGAGQMLGPLLVAPVIGDGYAMAFGIATVVLAMATAAAVIVARDGELKRT